ncbi:alpha/beta fold hydrolase [Moraxella sp. ZJ142]|uniref:alpha/beta fold hydrolase n=1 Tax=Moraxella marmotae TaxID=3344520 RepID=UPI0035D475A5
MTQTILSSNQIHRLHHRFFVPKGEIVATLLIVHGMSEHSGRYADFAQFLADHGVLVATYDQLGHGRTVKDKYELGFFDDKHPIQALCKDVIIMADKLKEQACDVPHFIIGHSMGSFVVRTVLIHHSIRFDGAILMGTAQSFGWLNHTSLVALNLLNKIAAKQPNPQIAALMNQYFLGQLRSPISPSPFAWLAENPAAIDAFEQDELCGFCFSNNGFFTLLALMQRAMRDDWYANMPSNYPILLISGKDDPVSHLGQDIERLHDALIRANHTVSTRLYPNMRHEPLHEIHAQRVYRDILAWLLRHCPNLMPNLSRKSVFFDK